MSRKTRGFTLINLTIIIIIIGILIGIYLGTIRSSAQVVNNSGIPALKVEVGTVQFTEVIEGGCFEGCSSGFIDVSVGNNNIRFQQTDETMVELGDLGVFEAGSYYAVNIRTVAGTLCAELWIRHQTDREFNLDEENRDLVASTCP